MTEPFIGEVQIYGFNFAPINWALAAGQLIPIRQASTLYALYGSIFGGDGSSTFGLPNLASRHACGAGQSPGNSNRGLGQTFGSTSVSLTQDQLPMHNHMLNTYPSSDPTALVALPAAASAIGNVADSKFNAFAAPGPTTAMNASALGISGVGAAHENRQPFLGLTYAVALVGNFPMFS